MAHTFRAVFENVFIIAHVLPGNREFTSKLDVFLLKTADIARHRKNIQTLRKPLSGKEMVNKSKFL